MESGRFGLAQKQTDILLQIELDLQRDLILIRLKAGDKASAAQGTLRDQGRERPAEKRRFLESSVMQGKHEPLVRAFF